jgi:hypothetical protein
MRARLAKSKAGESTAFPFVASANESECAFFERPLSGGSGYSFDRPLLAASGPWIFRFRRRRSSISDHADPSGLRSPLANAPLTLGRSLRP